MGRGVPLTQEPNGRFAVVTREGHEFLENPAFLLAAGSKVPAPPTLHKLPYTYGVIGSSRELR